MSKYDFEIDLSQNTSTGIILSRIQKGSVVLEFGCATGRMTRYMKEALDCRVYIVEYDQGAYETALKYAEDGLCDDIQTFRWAEKFQGIRFDAIIFADVLEHLHTPEKVLERAAGLLKDTGRLYASIPNITHNDILLKACEERFDYTPTGLLDDSHVHFWGFRNLAALSGRCGLNIERITGTYCATGDTEQYAQPGRERHLLLENILRERQCGEVYQFVVTFVKRDVADAAYVFSAPSIKSHIYLDTGNDFNANEIIPFDSVYSGHGSYLAHYTVENPGTIRRVRLDPIELQGCVLRQLSIRQGAQTLPLFSPNGSETAEEIILPGTDPMVCANVVSPSEPITIDAEIILPGEAYIKHLEETYGAQSGVLKGLSAENQALRGTSDTLSAENQALQRRITGLSGENQALQSTITGLSAENQALQDTITRLSGVNQAQENTIGVLSGENQKLQKTVAALSDENGELRRDVGSYIVLANKKDQYALALKGDLKVRTEELAARTEELAARTEELARYVAFNEELQRGLQYYQNLKIVRLRAFIARVIRGIVRRLKRLTGKGEQQ